MFDVQNLLIFLKMSDIFYDNISYIHTAFIYSLYLFQVFSRINATNKYHLTYLFYHFLLELFITINVILHVNFDVRIPIIVMSVVRIASPLCLYLQILSIQKQSKIGLRTSDYIILSSILIVNLLNLSGIKIFPLSFENVSSGGFFEMGVNYLAGREDVFVIITISALYYVFSFLKTEFGETKSTPKNSKILGLLTKWTYTYIFLYLISNLFIIFVLSFLLFDVYFSEFSILNKILVLIRLLVLASIPFLLKDLSFIKIKDITLDQSYFKQIEQYLNTYTYYLDPAFSISKLSLDLELRSDLISSCIKDNTQMTVPSFINSYRIKHACQLMQDGYLTNFSMLSLAEESGFSSQQSFNRSFKSIMNLTPSAYLNSINLK